MIYTEMPTFLSLAQNTTLNLMEARELLAVAASLREELRLPFVNLIVKLVYLGFMFTETMLIQSILMLDEQSPLYDGGVEGT